MPTTRTCAKFTPARIITLLLVLSALARTGPAAAQDDFVRERMQEVRAPAEPKPVRAPDPPAPPFGARGEWVVTGSSSIGISSTDYDHSQAHAFGVAASPGIDWFVARNVSVGADLGGGYSYSQGYGADGSLVGTRATSFSGGPRVAVNLPLGAAFSWYPRLTVGFAWSRQQDQLVSGTALSTAGSPLGYPTTTLFGPSMNLFAPLLWHAAPHLFVGFGPTLYHQFGTVQGGPDIGGQRTTVSAGVVVGGWWGGPSAVLASEPDDVAAEGEPSSEPSEAAEPSAPPPRARRFGDAGEFVVGSDFGLSVSHSGYAGSPASSTGVSVEPSVDYFVADHFALGLALDISYSSVTGLDTSAQAQQVPIPLTITNEVTRVGVAPRIALDVPLGARVSIDLRVALAFGASSYDERSATNESAYGDHYVSVGVSLPLLFHPVQHFFVGFGPSVGHDLSRDIYVNGVDTGKSNQGTTVGAGLTVGGWL